MSDKMWPREGYDELDAGIRFAVRVLHAAGFDTCQSCQGGSGHPYPEPTVDMIATGDDSRGFGALDALRAYGLPVAQVSLVWPIRNGHPSEILWRIEFVRTMEDRADEWPFFISSTVATAQTTKDKPDV